MLATPQGREILQATVNLAQSQLDLDVIYGVCLCVAVCVCVCVRLLTACSR
jgi:hypothetical protein